MEEKNGNLVPLDYDDTDNPGLEHEKKFENEIGADPDALLLSRNPLYRNPKFKIVVLVDFHDAYTLRQQFEFYKCALTCTPLFFQESGLRILRGNGTKTLVVSTIMRKRDLIKYYINKDIWNCPDGKCHIINVDLQEFYDQIRSITRKECIRIYQYAEFPNLLICQPYGGNKNARGHFVVKIQKYEDLVYKIEDPVKDNMNPNITVPLAEFCSSCSNLERVKYPHAILKVYSQGAHILAGNEIGSSSRTNHWGLCTGDYFSVKIPITVVKAMTKMRNFNQSGIVRIYGAIDGLVRIEVAVGCYGEVICYLVDPVDENE